MTSPRAGRLLYQTPDVGDQARRRLFLVSYHFPPDAAVGARRWEKLAHYVAERGWGMDVVMRYDTPGTPPEMTRLRALPSGVRVYGVPLRLLAVQRAEHAAWGAVQRLFSARGKPAASSYDTSASNISGASSPARPQALSHHEMQWALHTPRGYMRMWWAWADFAQIAAWGGDVAQVAAEIVRPDVHLAVISSGPPHMSHDAGRRISSPTGIPFVMDMRDPWAGQEQLVESVATPFWHLLATRYERRAVDQASLVAANTELARRALQARYPSRAQDIITVMNGVDDDPLPPSRRSGRFVIAHAGTVYLDRDPRALFQAAARVIRELSLTPEQFGLEFIGVLDAVGGFPIREVAQQEGIGAYVHTGPSRPYAQAMEFMAEATMLVTMSGTNLTAIPAKTFECMRFQSWLLALSVPGSATELLLQGSEADVVPPGDVEGIAAVIRRRYEQHVQGIAPPRLADDDRFSRRRQAKLLLDAIASRSAIIGV